MLCPKCESNRVRVIDSRPHPREVYRRRECISCGYRFTTIETVKGAGRFESKEGEEAKDEHKASLHTGNDALAGCGAVDGAFSQVDEVEEE